MDQRNGLLVGLALLAWSCCASAQEIVTMTAIGEGGSNTVSIASDQSVSLRTLRSSTGAGGMAFVHRDGVLPYYMESAFNPNDSQYRPDMTFAGPAVVEVRAINAATWAMLTIEIQPSQYPPDKSAIIGPHSGPMRCTMETSTDLVNWATATNDIVYPDSEEARFFRITLEREVGD